MNVLKGQMCTRLCMVRWAIISYQLDQRLLCCVVFHVVIWLWECVWRQRHWAAMELGCVLLVSYLSDILGHCGVGRSGDKRYHFILFIFLVLFFGSFILFFIILQHSCLIFLHLAWWCRSVILAVWIWDRSTESLRITCTTEWVQGTAWEI